MLVLGIDCSTRWTNAGLSRDGEVLSEINLELGRAQSSELPLLVESILSDAEIKMSELDLIAVANGPGYYTGIRTGVAYAAALAKALRIKAVPLSTLELFVYDLKRLGEPLAPVIKAKRDHVYAAVYSPHKTSLTPVRPPCFVSAAAFADMLKQYPEAVLVGNDAANYPELLSLPNKRELRASGCGGQAALMGEFYQDSAVNPEFLRGNYLRKPDIGPN